MSVFFQIIKHDIKLAFRNSGDLFNLLAFFVIAAVLFPFGVGSEPEMLKNIGVGVIWVCALFASVLAVPKIFEEDFEDGTLASLLLTGAMVEIIVFARVISHWLTNILPLIVISPLLAVFFHIEDTILPILIALLLGTPAIAVIATVGASLTLGIKRGGGLVAILILPLYIPVLIFGVGAVLGENFSENLAILFAFFLFMLPIGVYASAAAVKMALEDN